MSHRERHPPGGSAAAVPRPLEPLPARPRDPAAPAPLWDALYPTPPAAQQQALLALARQQGFLTAAQLPPAPPVADRARQLLARVLTVDGPSDLPPTESVEFALLDEELDAANSRPSPAPWPHPI